MNRKVFLKLSAIAVCAFALAACGSGKTEPEVKKFSSSGKVTGINKAKREVSIDHKEIRGFMSAMEMDFPVKDAAVLDDLKIGDEIEFELEKSDESAVVSNITKTKQSADAINGQSVYAENCAKCHGQNGEGTEKGISFLKGHAVGHPEEDFIKQVTFGEEGKMPAFKDKLTAEEIAAVVKYVRDEIQNEVRKAPSTHKH